jgi:hypothetical protein
MNSQFHDIESAFQVLRRQFRGKEISRREFIDQLKKLRIRDNQGRFWMIGAQTGKWYYFDGKEWIQSQPPVKEAKKVKCYSCGLDNEAGVEYCQRCGESLEMKESVCAQCGTKLDSPFQKCPVCSQESAAVSLAEEPLFRVKAQAPENFVLRHLNPVSLFFFSGGTGLILGVFIGAFAGASGYFSGLANSLPEFLATLHGTLMGGIIFAGLGGILGFALIGGLGYLEGLLINAISSIVGGFRVSLEKTTGEDGQEKRPGSGG